MAHTKSKGSTSLGRDSRSQRLGVKLFGGEKVKTSQIIIRQRGTKYRLGKNVKKGKDDTIFALKDGFVKFEKKKIRKYTGLLEKVTVVSVVDKK